eukprot:TRINITY_DN37495_c0_g1_i1.p1 TRINITY_DN37495_c0_g1~~TRINITY_DN37495_c0_g1_i1.p1  ORF type:complete len:316 (+),score=90.04 TRINITY_DN37495_c0_g1_i1:64-1011(+)
MQPEAVASNARSSDVTSMSLPELVDLARTLSVDITSCMTREDIALVVGQAVSQLEEAAPAAVSVEAVAQDDMTEGVPAAAAVVPGGELPIASVVVPAGNIGQFRGTIKAINTEKGFAFIQCDQTHLHYRRDVYVNLAEVDEDLQCGDSVDFSVIVTEDGKPQAKQISRQLPLGRYRGVVKSFVPKAGGKGYGFIQSPTTQALYGRDVFLSQHETPPTGLAVGTPVEFGVEMNLAKQPQARQLRICGDPPEGQAVKTAPKPRPGYRQPWKPPPGAVLYRAGHMAQKWRCICGFANRAKNMICGGTGPLGCNLPRQG